MKEEPVIDESEHLDQSTIKLKDPTKPIDNVKALNQIMNCNPLSVKTELPEITGNVCFLLNVSKVGGEFYDGQFYTVTDSEQKTNITSGKDGPVWYKLTRLRDTHTTFQNLHRLVVVTDNSHGIKGELAVVQYRFDEEPHDIYNNVPVKKTVL